MTEDTKSAAQAGLAGDSFTEALREFLSELLGVRSGYGLDDLGSLDSPAEAEALIRLRVRIREQLLTRRWLAPPDEVAALERDRLLLEERDDEDVLLATAAWSSHEHEVAQTPMTSTTDALSGQSAEVELEQMRQALQSRAIIEQAKGIAMERYGLPAQAAWAWLVRTSQERNEKLRKVAELLVDSVLSGRLPS